MGTDSGKRLCFILCSKEVLFNMKKQRYGFELTALIITVQKC
jgi:hypothetical protein